MTTTETNDLSEEIHELHKILGFYHDGSTTLNVSDEQRFEVQNLASKLTIPPSFEGFDLLSKDRFIIHSGKILKRSRKSLVSHTSTKYLVLLNDLLLITKEISTKSSSSLLMYNAPLSIKYNIKQILSLESITLVRIQASFSFEVVILETNGSSDKFEFTAESIEDKIFWCNAIRKAIIDNKSQVASNNSMTLKPGWINEIFPNSLHAYAYFGDLQNLQKTVENYQANEKSMNIDNQDEYGMTAMHYAAWYNHYDIVDYLIDAGANINALNHESNSCLMLATANGNEKIVSLLLNNNAVIKYRNKNNRDALLLALLYATNSLGLESIIQGMKRISYDLNQYDSNGSSAIHDCAVLMKFRAIALICKNGANVNLLHEKLRLTPLQYICSSNVSHFPDLDTVQILLNNGAYTNVIDINTDETPVDMLLTTFIMKKKSESEGKILFIRSVFPIALEIIKRGGLYSEELVLGLPGTFQESFDVARKKWMDTNESEYFFDFVNNHKSLCIQKEAWHPNEESKSCMICRKLFTLTLRRHHCRICGVLCCASCSSKKLSIGSVDSFIETPSKAAQSRNDSITHLSTDDSSSISSPSKHGSNLSQRACDSCFNKYNFLSNVYHEEEIENMRFEKLKLASLSPPNSPESLSSLSSPDLTEMKKVDLFFGANVESNSHESDNTEGLSNNLVAVNKLQESFVERGEKIEQLAEISSEMEKGAGDYKQLTKELVANQKKKSWF